MLWLWTVLGIVGVLAGAIVVLGLTQPAGHVASARATFARPPAELFAAISDHDGQTKWRSGMKSLELLPPQQGKTVFRETTGFGPVTYIVDESTPPTRYVTRILDETLPYDGKWTFELAPSGAGTQVTITEAGRVKVFLFRALSVFFSKTATMEQYLKELGAKFGEQVTPEPTGA
jgi:uncharacterized protein YndB with AHSA1/START domain